MVKKSSPELVLNIATYYGLMNMADSAEYYLNAFNPPDHPEDLDATQAFLLGEFYLILGRETLGLLWNHPGFIRLAEKYADEL